MGVMWTTEQQKVIDSRDCNILEIGRASCRERV